MHIKLIFFIDKNLLQFLYAKTINNNVAGKSLAYLLVQKCLQETEGLTKHFADK